MPFPPAARPAPIEARVILGDEVVADLADEHPRDPSTGIWGPSDGHEVEMAIEES
jgi:hypothetical protein